ncbi:hypothetical protein L0903_000873 [Listeria innocua]|nr:hypothetical protein [Listeria innocua]EIS4942524.1 hypothetical protein [Listeria innocua]EIS4945569.1 hypothetical protein [Listeria innocua]EIT3266160.1 hypothetical protein [Listeria innocua]HAP0442858.1 hypothetical protein [Listeria innocua]
MNKTDVFNLAKSLNCEYEVGLWSEINSFFEYQEDNISSFDLKFQKEGKKINNYFSLDVNMKILAIKQHKVCSINWCGLLSTNPQLFIPKKKEPLILRYIYCPQLLRIKDF